MKQIVIWSLMLMAFSNHPSFSNELKIVTVDSQHEHILRQKTEPISQDELPQAREIADQLFLALKPHMPAAGLAAPQIGIKKSVFIFSYDRDPNHLEVVINPTFEPIGNEQIAGWEGCLSILLSDNVRKLAQVPRYARIKVSYINWNGEEVQKILEGFAAKVFQHEFDHLQGIECIDRDDAVVKSFNTKEEIMAFLSEVKKDDSTRYIKPQD